MERSGKVCKRNYHRLCKVCGNEFYCAKPKGIYCGNLCRNVEWRSKNKERDKNTKDNWKFNNIERHRLNQSFYQKERCKQDPLYLLKRRLRARLGRLPLRHSASHIDSLGCSIEELKTHLELKFYSGMTWENYGDIWEIDHHKPLMTAKTTQELIKLCHFTNLKPLLVEDHIIKTSKEKSL